MALTAVALIVLVTTCFVRGQVNLLSRDFKPPQPSPQPTQQTAATNSLRLPFNLPSLLPPSSNKNPGVPFSNQQSQQSKFSPQFNSQFTPHLPPTLPPQLQSQLPIQLPQHFQQQVPFQLQPQFPIQTPPTFPSHIPPFLQNSIQSALHPPQFPNTLPTKFPPPPPPKSKFQLPPPKSSNYAFPSLPVHSGTKNVPLQGNRAPRTLQMIGSSSGQVFQKITDNIRPGGNAWYYQKNTPPKRSPHPQVPGTTPSPLLYAPRLIPLNQFNQLEQITKLNQQNQPQIQTSLNQWSLLNNQHLNSLNTIGTPWAGATNFNQAPQLSNLNNQYFNNLGSSSLKSFDHPLSNLNSLKSSNSLNLNNYGSSFGGFDTSLNSSPNLNSFKSLNSQNLNSHGFNSLNSSPNSNSFKSLSGQNGLDNFKPSPNLNNFKSLNNQNVNSHGFDSMNSSPSLNSFKTSNSQNLNSHGSSSNSFDNLNSSPNLNSFKSSNKQNLHNHGSSLSSGYENLNPGVNNNVKSTANQNLNSHGSSLNSFDNLNSSPNLNSFRSSNKQNLHNHGSFLSSGYENQSPSVNNNVKNTANQNLNSHGFDSLKSSPNLNSFKSSNNQNQNTNGFSSSNGYGNLGFLPSVNNNNNNNNNNNIKSTSNQNINSHGSSSNNYDNLNPSPSSSNQKNTNATPVSQLHINVHSDSTTPQNANQAAQSNQFKNLNQSPFTSNYNQQTPFTSHQQSSSFYPNAPFTPQDVFRDSAFQISAITIPEPEKPQFDTLRSQVSALKAKHKEFFSDHHTEDSPQQNSIQSSYQHPKPVYGPVYGPPSAQQPSQQSLVGINPWTPMEQSKFTPPKWNPNKFEFQQSTSSLLQDHEQYNTPKKTLPLKNDFVGFPPAKGSIKNELNFISNWEKGIGIIHKNDHGNADKGQTIVSSGDTDDFKKIDKQESSNVVVVSMEQMLRRMAGKNETTKKHFTGPKKTFGKGKPPTGKKGRETSEEQKSEEITSIQQEAPNNNAGQTNETQKAEARNRRKRDISGSGSTTEGVVVSPENVNTAAPILEPNTDPEVNQQPRAEPLVAPATESLETITDTRNVKALVGDRRVGDVLDSSEEAALFLDLEDYDLSQAEARAKLDSAEGDILSGEDLDEVNSAGLAYDDYDDAYLDDDNDGLSIQSRSDSFIFEELDGTTSRPHAMPVISERIDNFALIPQPEALVDPRNLHGRDLIYFLEEAIRNSSLYLPDEAEDRSFDVVDPPNDVIKFPYYDRTEEPINVDSALRFAENLTTFSQGLYESKNGNQCHEVDVEIAEDPAEPDSDGFLPVRRLKRLGSKVDCLKNKHFGKDPLDNPLFKEEFVGAGRSSSSDAVAPQPDPSIAVFSDVIRLIKQHLTEEQRSKAKEFNGVVTPRQLNLSDAKNPPPNIAVLEQLRLGKRRPLLPNKQTKKLEEPKAETSQNTTSESHGLKIVFPRRLNITKTYDEAKKSKSKLVDIEGYKAKLNHSRSADHESYKTSLARKLNFDKLDKSKIPRSQRRDSDDGLPFEPLPHDTSPFMPVFDITSFYPRYVARAEDGFPYPEKGFATKYDQLEREADELISAVQKSSAEAERRIVNSGNARAENSKQLKDKPYGTSYSPSYQQYRVLSRKDDQKKTPTVDELVNFYSRRRSNDDDYEAPSISLPATNLPIFDVSSFYPRFVNRENDDHYQAQPFIKRKDTKITLDDLEALQAPKITPNTDSSYNPVASKLIAGKQVRDDIADFYEGSQSQPTGSTASVTANEGHHTFKKSAPPNPDLPETDKATFHLDQPSVGSSHRTHRLHPVKVVPRKRYKTNAKNLKRPPLKYRRKKLFSGFFD